MSRPAHPRVASRRGPEDPAEGPAKAPQIAKPGVLGGGLDGSTAAEICRGLADPEVAEIGRRGHPELGREGADEVVLRQSGDRGEAVEIDRSPACASVVDDRPQAPTGSGPSATVAKIGVGPEGPAIEVDRRLFAGELRGRLGGALGLLGVAAPQALEPADEPRRPLHLDPAKARRTTTAELTRQALHPVPLAVEAEVLDRLLGVGVTGVDLLGVEEHEITGLQVMRVPVDRAGLMPAQLGAEQVLDVKVGREGRRRRRRPSALENEARTGDECELRGGHPRRVADRTEHHPLAMSGT